MDWRYYIPGKKKIVNNEMTTKLTELEGRVHELEQKLEEKDRELREVSIQRSEFISQLNVIINYLRTNNHQNNSIRLIEKILGLRKSSTDNDKIIEDTEGSRSVALDPGAGTGTMKMDNSQDKIDEDPVSIDHKIEQKIGDKLDILETFEPDKLDFLGKYSYRERMILMNRIDIYRLFVTIIIISSQIKYPRAITKPEENDLKTFIDELNEFENLLLDLNMDENLIWEKGKVCEKHAIQLFTRFFNI